MGIAAIAVVNDLILVTNNTSDYADFQNLQPKTGLSLNSPCLCLLPVTLFKSYGICATSCATTASLTCNIHRADLPAVSKMMQETEAKLTTGGLSMEQSGRQRINELLLILLVHLGSQAAQRVGNFANAQTALKQPRILM